MKMYEIADRIETVMMREKQMFANLDWFSAVSYTAWHPDADVHADLRHLAHRRLGRPRDRAAHRQQDHPPTAVYTGPEDLEFMPIEKRK
jgi:2-methylcitrate synthase